VTLRPQIDDLLELRHRARTIGLASRHRVNSALAGMYTSVFRGQGMDYEETREYREGDEIRNMDWRVTARTGTPHLKVFREERERAVMLCVDVGPHMSFGTRGTFKSVQAARAAALVGWAASGSHDRVGGLLYGDGGTGPRIFPPSRARRELWRLLRALTEVASRPTSARDPLADALDRLLRAVPVGGLIFLIGDLSRDPASLQQPLGRLRQRHEVVLLPVDDPADRELPDMGRVLFRAPDGQRTEVDTSSVAGRRHYRETWEHNRKALEVMAMRLGITLIPVPTQGDTHRVLLDGLRRRAGQIRGR
jgi:uncharacterized protein (DUF58 family)